MPRLLIAFVLMMPLAWPGPAAASESAPARTSRTTATLVTESDTVPAGGQVRVALRLRTAPGWHTYWRNPGEAGVPTELAVTLAGGAKAGPIDWPAPERVSEGAIVTYGFTGELVLPVTLTAGDGPLSGELRANWLVCKDICVPEEAVFPIAIPIGPGTVSGQGAIFAAHDRAVPRPSPWPATIAADGTLTVRGGGQGVTEADFIPSEPNQIVDAAPRTLTLRDDGLSLGLRLAKEFPPGADLTGVLVLRDRTGTRTNLLVTAHPGPAPEPALPLARALLFAFLGGLILNAMPCVFPILAMKAVGFAAGVVRGGARAHAVSYTAGVVVTFVCVAFALLAARAGGQAAGWGFQLASPAFVAVMAWVLFLAGLNLSGLFQIGDGIAGLGQGLAAREGHWGSFFTGVLAVVVASPCTTPFMGAAVTAGLAAPAPVTLAVFIAMGLGLASPYLLLSAAPGIARLLPRPGRWMEVLRQVLAFPMYGAAVWLLWVVSQEAGADGVLAAGAGFVLLGFAVWLLGVTRLAGRRWGWAGAALAVCLAAAPLPRLGTVVETSQDAEAFSASRLAALRAEGRPVFVNLTAAWCVTCQVNERVAISDQTVRDAFGAHHVAYLKGDWTRQDPAISGFLRDHGRDGVPLYLYYAPHAAEATVLPQILTATEMLRVLAAAS